MASSVGFNSANTRAITGVMLWARILPSGIISNSDEPRSALRRLLFIFDSQALILGLDFSLRHPDQAGISRMTITRGAKAISRIGNACFLRQFRQEQKIMQRLNSLYLCLNRIRHFQFAGRLIRKENFHRKIARQTHSIEIYPIRCFKARSQKPRVKRWGKCMKPILELMISAVFYSKLLAFRMPSDFADKI